MKNLKRKTSVLAKILYFTIFISILLRSGNAKCIYPQGKQEETDYFQSDQWYFFSSKLDSTKCILRASLVAQTVKNLPAMQETWIRSLGQEDLLEKGMYPLQYSHLENSMDRGAWQATVHWVTESDTTEHLTHTHTHTCFLRHNDTHTHTHTHTHTRVLSQAQ